MIETAVKSRLTAATFAFALLAPGAAMAAKGAEEGGSWLTLLFFTINFVLFAIILVKFAGPAISSFFAERAKSLRSDLGKLKGALQEAEDLANRAGARMARLEGELAQLKAELDRETAYQAGRVRELAKSTAERVRRDAEMTSGAIREAGRRHVREQLAQNSANVARELIARSFEDRDQDRLIDGFMEKLGQEAAR